MNDAKNAGFIDTWTDSAGNSWTSTATNLTVRVPMMGNPDASAVSSFRYRLREASRQALELGDRLLQLSQDAPEPNVTQLKEMRELENSLDVCIRYYLRDVANPTIRSA